MAIDLDALEATARAATQRPWMVAASKRGLQTVVCSVHDCMDRVGGTVIGASRSAFAKILKRDWSPDRREADAAHIAAASPLVVLALVAELRLHRSVVAALRETQRSTLGAKTAMEMGRVAGRRLRVLDEAMAALDDSYPCRHPGCTVRRTRAEGGATFTVCDQHWEKKT